MKRARTETGKVDRQVCWFAELLTRAVGGDDELNRLCESDGKPQQSAGLGNGQRIILSPPEPEPKTAVELLDDVIKAFDKWKEYENSLPFIESIEAARNRTE